MQHRRPFIGLYIRLGWRRSSRTRNSLLWLDWRQICDFSLRINRINTYHSIERSKFKRKTICGDVCSKVTQFPFYWQAHFFRRTTIHIESEQLIDPICFRGPIQVTFCRNQFANLFFPRLDQLFSLNELQLRC